MAMIATDIKGLLSISMKPRHDSHTDQYNRIFMMKLFLVSSVVMGISWYQDSIHCMIPEAQKIDKGFVSSTCWIQGVYVYKELRERIDDTAYFGIPYSMDQNGYQPDIPKQPLCNTDPKLIDNKKKKENTCVPMKKTFFTQYQYMPFLMASFALLYYLPYVFFKYANNDLISLRAAIKTPNAELSQQIAKHYFDKRGKSQRKLKLRVLLNIVVKCLYLLSNIVAFIGLDNILNGEFKGYGTSWIAWTKLKNYIAYDYMGLRDHPKPGNLLLPPFGYCEVWESGMDVRQSVVNKHKFVCELSQNILYQYSLIVLWFAIIIGMVVSCVGIILLIVHYVIGIVGLKTSTKEGRQLLKILSFRELEYLEYLRKKNIGLYGEVMEKLKERFLTDATNSRKDSDEYRPSSRSDRVPLYPDVSLKHPQYNNSEKDAYL